MQVAVQISINKHKYHWKGWEEGEWVQIGPKFNLPYFKSKFWRKCLDIYSPDPGSGHKYF